MHFNEQKEFLIALTNEFQKMGPYGIRINNEKYVLADWDIDRRCGSFTKKNGGAIFAFSNTTFIFASYNTTKEGSNKVKQFRGQCYEVVHDLTKYFTELNL